MNNLYDTLEICLQEIEKGAEVESVLLRYPDLADELRPILQASIGAKSMAVTAPSADVVRRNRSRVLQHAAQMREGKVKSSQRIWFASLRRIAVTLVVVIVLFVSGTGLVGASSNTLPGDNLYPVKRTWEGLRLFFTFNPLERQALESEHENERLHEVQEVLAEGRSTEVDFNGMVTSQTGNEWVVANVRVLISNQTEIRDQGITVGSPVRVRGVTQGNGTVLADRIRLLSSDAKLPDAEDGHESEGVNDNNSGPGSVEETPNIEETEAPEPENDNSGNNNDSGTNDNLNENSNSNDNSGSSNDGSGINDNTDNSGSNDNSGDHSNDSSGGSDNSNDGGGGDSHSNDNGDDSGSGGGGDNSGSGGGSGSGGDD
jgi:uncharacterized membrane protein YgcG